MRAELYAEEKKPKEMFRYEHPDIIRKYLQEGPCAKCTVKACETPCRAYLRWWDARMELARKKVGAKCQIDIFDEIIVDTMAQFHDAVAV